MGLRRQDFREDIGNIVFGGDKDELHDIIGDLLAKPRHFNAEVAVAAGDHVVADHRNAGLIILIKERRICLSEAEFAEKVAEP